MTEDEEGGESKRKLVSLVQSHIDKLAAGKIESQF